MHEPQLLGPEMWGEETVEEADKELKCSPGCKYMASIRHKEFFLPVTWLPTLRAARPLKSMNTQAKGTAVREGGREEP